MKKTLKATLLILSFCFLAAASNVTAGSQNDPCPAILNGQGSTLLAPFVKASATDYNALNPQITVTYNSDPAHTGSCQGILQLQAGVTFFGGTDIPPTCAQQTFIPGNRILTFPVAIAGVAVGYNNASVPQGSLELDANTLAMIFTGVITNWNQIDSSFPSLPITVVVRSDCSGDTNNFTTYLTDEASPSNWPFGSVSLFPTGIPSFIYASGNSGVAAAILANNGSIGYLAYGFAVSNAISTAGVQNSSLNFIFPTVASIGAAAVGVCVPFDLNISTIDTPNPNGYPIASPTNLIAYEYQFSECDACELANFLYYMGTTAQKNAATFSLAPLPASFQDQYINNLNFIQKIGSGCFEPRNCRKNDFDCDKDCVPFKLNVINKNVNNLVNSPKDVNEAEAGAHAKAKAKAKNKHKSEKFHKYKKKKS